ncbi:MAG TPA: capsule biosynthesis GfcC family protein, partial [Burkholderiaceae bacterium]|nr:capsule biosynthesis GfcC family protein [Burkholderiaceae bacterium]
MTRPLPAATTLARPIRPSRLCLAVAQVCIVLGMPTAAGNAQAGGGATASVASAQTAIRAGERLSDWLLRNPPGAGDDPAALAWQAPSARQAQAELKQALLAQLWSARDLQADETTRQRLADWLRSLPVTGRVPLAIVDARWLQANPDQDPILAPGHALVLPQRPGTVTLLADDGRPCAVAHRPGTQARGYLQACIGGAASEADMAWIVQPDGRVQRFGIATWNAEPQSEPAPGAWIWAPRRSAAWPEDFSDRLATFLATQSPTPIAARAAPTQTTTPIAARAAPTQTGTPIAARAAPTQTGTPIAA